MPCYVVRTVSVKFNVKHIELLEKALKKLNLKYQIEKKLKLMFISGKWGETIAIDLEKGEAKFPQDLQNQVNEIKRSYSEQALIKVAKKQKWILKDHKAETKTKKYAFVKY